MQPKHFICLLVDKDGQPIVNIRMDVAASLARRGIAERHGNKVVLLKDLDELIKSKLITMNQVFRSRDVQLYENIMVHNSNGELIFLCDKKRMNWYLGRNLATKEAEDRIKLKIKTNGDGHKSRPDFLKPRKNICVVCCSPKYLTKHHIVPYCFTKHFPPQYKYVGFYDMLPICFFHHQQYEEHASDFKKEIYKNFNLELSQEEKDKIYQLTQQIKFCRSYFRVKNNNKIPADKKEVTLKKIKKEIGETVTEADIKATSKLTTRGMENQNKIKFFKSHFLEPENLHNFVVMWRQHFLSTMKLQYIPDGWSIETNLAKAINKR